MTCEWHRPGGIANCVVERFEARRELWCEPRGELVEKAHRPEEPAIEARVREARGAEVVVDLPRREELAVRVHAIEGCALDELPRALEYIETVECEPVDHREEEDPSRAQDPQGLAVRAPRILPCRYR